MDWDEMIGKRVRFVAVYTGCTRKGLLLHDVATQAGDSFRDHMWLPNTKRFRKLRLRAGMQISFKAKVKRYRKRDGTWQFNVQNLSEIEVMG